MEEMRERGEGGGEEGEEVEEMGEGKAVFYVYSCQVFYFVFTYHTLI